MLQSMLCWILGHKWVPWAYGEHADICKHCGDIKFRFKRLP